MMILGFVGNYFYKNNSLVELERDSSKIIVGLSVYEILKIVSGIPLFFESHIDRLHNSLTISGIDGYNITNDEFLHQVENLCKINQSYFGNIELRVVKTSKKIISYLGFVQHTYPFPLNYINGVNTSLMQLERINPNAKVKQTHARIEADKFLENNTVFEVLLVDSQSNITEGSRSNMFYIKNNIVYTAPLEFVLPGITRKFVIEALKNSNITINEKLLSVKELREIDIAFLCGTSLGILPIRQIDNYKYDVKNKVLRTVMLQFNDIIKQYIITNTK